MVQLIQDDWLFGDESNTPAERQRVTDLLRNDPDLLDMLGLR